MVADHESDKEAQDGRTGPSIEEARLDPDGLLRGVLGRKPGAEELALWAAMPGERRDKAMDRIPILRRWVERQGEMTAAEAALGAKVAVSRWYEIAAAWKASPTLASVGSFAMRPGRRGQRLDGDVVNVLQAILPGIVKTGEKEKVGTIVTRLQEDERLRGMALPHVNTLRTMVEREKRRLKSEAQVGLRPGLDVTALDMSREDGAHHLMFAVVDRTSRLILGFALGGPVDLEESRAAYAKAAADALARIADVNAPNLPWADQTERVDVIVGEDRATWTTAFGEYKLAGRKPELFTVDSDRRFGRYFKLVAGSLLGNLRLHFARTGVTGQVAGGPVFSDAEATSAIEVEMARHNAAVLVESVAVGAPRPAPGTLQVLEFLADG